MSDVFLRMCTHVMMCTYITGALIDVRWYNDAHLDHHVHLHISSVSNDVHDALHALHVNLARVNWQLSARWGGRRVFQ